MGLFRKSSEPAVDAAPDAMSPADAFAGIAMCAVYADGVLDSAEDDVLTNYLTGLDVFGALSDREMTACLQRVQRLAAAHGDTGLLERCAAALPERLRPTAYFVAADLLMTDGEVGAEEHAFLRRLKSKLAVDDATSAKILDVLAIKHRA